MTAAILSFEDHRRARMRALAELHRVEATLREAGIRVELDRGASDEGEPWAAFIRPEDGALIAHVAIIDGRVVVDSPAFARPLWGDQIGPLLERLEQQLRRASRSRQLDHFAIAAVTVALAAAHLSEADASAWNPLSHSDMAIWADMLGSLPLLVILRAAQSVQMRAALGEDEPTHSREWSSEPASPGMQEEQPDAALPAPAPAGQAAQPETAAMLLQKSALSLAEPRVAAAPSSPSSAQTAETAAPAEAAMTVLPAAARLDPRELDYAMQRLETQQFIASGSVTGADVDTALAWTEAYIRAQRAGIEKVEFESGINLVLHADWYEPEQLFTFTDGSSLRLVGIGYAAAVGE